MQTAVLGGEADLQMAKTTAVEEDFPLESWIKRPQLILVANSHREASTLRAYHPPPQHWRHNCSCHMSRQMSQDFKKNYLSESIG